MIASGKRLSDIAEELSLSPKTVSVYRARVLEKLGLSNNSELTVYAIRNGLVMSPSICWTAVENRSIRPSQASASRPCSRSRSWVAVIRWSCRSAATSRGREGPESGLGGGVISMGSPWLGEGLGAFIGAGARIFGSPLHGLSADLLPVRTCPNIGRTTVR